MGGTIAVHPVMVKQLAPMLAEKHHTLVEMPDTIGFNAALHARRVTVQGGI